LNSTLDEWMDRLKLRATSVARGFAMLLLGTAPFLYLTSADDQTGWLSWMELAFASVCTVGGLGLLVSGRWGWPLALLAALYAVAFGISIVASMHRVGGSPTPAFILWIIPGSLLLIGLLTSRSRSWTRAGHVRQTDPHG